MASGKQTIQEKLLDLEKRSQRGAPQTPGVKKSKKLSAKQQKRRSKAVERAEAVKDMLGTKVTKAVGRHEKVIDRTKPDQNEKRVDEKLKQQNPAFQDL